MVGYNLTGIASNTTGFLGFTQAINNELMFGWLGILILIGITTVFFLAFIMGTNDVKKAFVATSFISFGLGLLLRALKLIPDLALYITLIFTAATIALTWRRN